MVYRLFPIAGIDETPLAREDWRRRLTEEGFVFVDRAREADLFVGGSWPLSHLPSWRLRLGHRFWRWRPILLWAHEPRYVPLFEAEIPARNGWPQLSVMNCYTDGVYFGNCNTYGWAIDRQLPFPIEVPDSGGSCVAGMATFIPDIDSQEFLRDGVDLDLTARRQELLLRGYRRGVVDVYGRGWPVGMVREDSRGKGWWSRKREVLRGYRFNICLENTNWPYYCSEKIWDAIAAGCLPIYHGAGNAIYEDFPTGSFVDSAGFADADALFDALAAMDDDEWLERYGRCVATFNRLHREGRFHDHMARMFDALVERLRFLRSESGWR